MKHKLFQVTTIIVILLFALTVGYYRDDVSGASGASSVFESAERQEHDSSFRWDKKRSSLQNNGSKDDRSAGAAGNDSPAGAAGDGSADGATGGGASDGAAGDNTSGGASGNGSADGSSDDAMQDSLSDEQNIIIDFPEDISEDQVKINQNFSPLQINIEFPVQEKDFFYTHPVHGNGKNVRDYQSVVLATMASVNINLDGLYEYEASFADHQLSLSLKNVSEIYDYVVIIDPAHGGSDLGSTHEETTEKELTLAISQQIEAYADELRAKGIGLFFTRETDRNVTTKERLCYAENADLYISVHINTNDNPEASGIQAFCVNNGVDGSKKAAAVCLEQVSQALDEKNDMVIMEIQSDLLSEIEIPAFEIQLGFLSNEAELQRIKTKEYKKKSAVGIIHAILEIYEKGLE